MYETWLHECLGYPCRTRILEKMRMQNNAELIHYAIQNGLVK